MIPSRGGHFSFRRFIRPSHILGDRPGLSCKQSRILLCEKSFALKIIFTQRRQKAIHQTIKSTLKERKLFLWKSFWNVPATTYLASQHRVRLSGATLSIRQNAGVVALHDGHFRRHTDVLIDLRTNLVLISSIINK